MSPLAKARLASGATATIKLHDRRNVILILSDDANPDVPVVWGFPTVGEWRTFLKACVRFDNELGNVKPGNEGSNERQR
jgi:hypothetical protein